MRKILYEYKLFNKNQFDLEKFLRQRLNIRDNVTLEHNGEDFKLIVKYPNQGEMKSLFDRLKPHLQDLGARKLKVQGSKYTQYGVIQFQLSNSIQDKLKLDFDDQENQKEQNYIQSISGIDIDKYKPSQAVIDKLMSTREKASMINTKAIKNVDKLLTYYYAAELIGWGDLSARLKAKGLEDLNISRNIFNAITEKVDKNTDLADTRSNLEIKHDLPKTDLFTFQDESRKQKIWLPKKFFQYFMDRNIPVQFLNRSYGGDYDTNGRQWSERENMIIDPNGQKPLNISVVVNSNESGSPNKYSVDGGPIRVSMSQILDYIDNLLKIKGIISESINTNYKFRLNEKLFDFDYDNDDDDPQDDYIEYIYYKEKDEPKYDFDQAVRFLKSRCGISPTYWKWDYVLYRLGERDYWTEDQLLELSYNLP